MSIDELKVDPKYPYHYLISVGMRDMYSKDRGKLYLKHGPLFFTNNDVEKLQEAKMLSEDKLFKTEVRDALNTFGVRDLVQSVSGLFMAASSNMCTVHHFSSDVLIDDDYWETFVNSTNEIESEKERLFSATINGRRFI